MLATKRLLSCAALLAAAVGCSSQPPSAPKPDGRTRQAVNTSERIAAYAERNKPTADHRAKAAPARNGAVVTQIGDAADCVNQQRQLDTGGTVAAPDPKNHSAGSLMSRQVAVAFTAHEMLEIRPRSLVFSVPCSFGTSSCQPSSHLAALLLRAALRSTRIEIRGRTDADRPNPADQALAQRRAQAIKRYLSQHGIDAARLATSALASGGHIADNSDAEGRASNRRVEIEVMDLDPHAYSSISTGDDHEPD
jgi:outer membrane protein OmpA-like peptidoglycan-associated protein